MIRVTYDGAYSLTMEGHAGKAPVGQDIICAGASTLIYSLAQMLARHEDECLCLNILIGSGEGRVTVTPSLAFETACRGAFETVMCGFEKIAEEYPDYIQLHRE